MKCDTAKWRRCKRGTLRDKELADILAVNPDLWGRSKFRIRFGDTAEFSGLKPLSDLSYSTIFCVLPPKYRLGNRRLIIHSVLLCVRYCFYVKILCIIKFSQIVNAVLCNSSVVIIISFSRAFLVIVVCITF